MAPLANTFQPKVPDVISGVQKIPVTTPPATPDGPGVGILSQVFARSEPRVLTLGIPSGNPMLGQTFPPVPFNGGPFASLPAGAVNDAGTPLSYAAFPYPCCTCILEYGVGSASQKCFIDWYQGSYNLPSCEFVRVSALPWGSRWSVFALQSFSAVASVAPGQIQGAHVPTVTAVGDFVAGVAQVFGTPANARAIEALAIDPTVVTTVSISGAAAGTRNLFTGAMSPGWTPLELDLGVNAVGVVSSANAALRLQWYLEL